MNRLIFRCNKSIQEKSGETITKKIPQFQCCNVKTSNSEACKKHETEAHDLFLNGGQNLIKNCNKFLNNIYILI